MATSKDQSNQAIMSLTGVRGFAAIWVVLYHLRSVFAEAFPNWPLLNLFVEFGYLGVDLFAFLSGFIIAFVYNERLQLISWQSSRRYLWLRFVRTYPLHLFILGLFILVFIYERGVQSWNVLPYDATLIRQLFLVNGLGFEHQWGWNVPSWTLSSEWACYLLFPLLAPFIHRVSNGYTAMTMAIITLGSTITCMILLGHPYFDALLDWGILRIIGEFYTGCWLYRIYKSGIFTHWPMGAIGLGAAVISLFALLFALWVPVAIAGFAILILALAYDQQPMQLLLGNRISVYLGEISYSIYLLHWFIISNSELWGIKDLAARWQILLLLCITLTCAALTYHLVEQTSRQKLRNFIFKIKLRKKASEFYKGL